MGKFNAEFKESLLKKVFTKNNSNSIHYIALEANIPPSTLYGWIRNAKSKDVKLKNNNYDSGQKFDYCLKYFNLEESERGEFLRSNGLYSYQLDAWKKDFIINNSNVNTKVLKGNKSDKSDKNKIKILEQELRRKEKALAETATLLTLKKKFQDLDLDEE